MVICGVNRQSLSMYSSFSVEIRGQGKRERARARPAVVVVDPPDRTIGLLLAHFVGGVKAGVWFGDVGAGANCALRFASASGHVLLRFIVIL